MGRTVAVIYNPAAGGGELPGVRERVAKAFADHGAEARVLVVGEDGDAVALARRAVGEGYEAVVAAGGDGTVSAVASALVGGPAALGVLPLGTLNHFAQDAGLPLDLGAAVEAIARGRAVPVDVGEVNGRVFVNNSSLGLYPRMVRRRARQQERLGRNKWVAMAWAAVSTLRRFPFLSVRLRDGENDFVRRTPFVFIGNNEYTFAGFTIGKRERLDGGRLSLYVAHRPSRIGLLWLAVSAVFGRLRDVENFDVLVSREFRIETRRRRIAVANDGEVSLMTAPLEYRLRPGALKLLRAEEGG
jgi:diacylglycerol kinase family enzyme